MKKREQQKREQREERTAKKRGVKEMRVQSGGADVTLHTGEEEDREAGIRDSIFSEEESERRERDSRSASLFVCKLKRPETGIVKSKIVSALLEGDSIRGLLLQCRRI